MKLYNIPKELVNNSVNKPDKPDKPNITLSFLYSIFIYKMNFWQIVLTVKWDFELCLV